MVAAAQTTSYLHPDIELLTITLDLNTAIEVLSAVRSAERLDANKQRAVSSETELMSETYKNKYNLNCISDTPVFNESFPEGYYYLFSDDKASIYFFYYSFYFLFSIYFDYFKWCISFLRMI